MNEHNHPYSDDCNVCVRNMLNRAMKLLAEIEPHLNEWDFPLTLQGRVKAICVDYYGEVRPQIEAAQNAAGQVVLDNEPSGNLRAHRRATRECSPAPAAPTGGIAEADAELIAMLEAASRDDRLADGMLYRKAAARIEELARENADLKDKLENQKDIYRALMKRIQNAEARLEGK